MYISNLAFILYIACISFIVLVVLADNDVEKEKPIISITIDINVIQKKFTEPGGLQFHYMMEQFEDAINKKDKETIPVENDLLISCNYLIIAKTP